ncbi:hypothetical protein WA026_018954 [Henosepilachna vigintioctopunctata]|uniref:Uncharacterized protein n=1 Tax=Henosepilachna vigintioctopunctata TaxID=420089 RepID=A0AAW1UNN1_9CUCU
MVEAGLHVELNNDKLTYEKVAPNIGLVIDTNLIFPDHVSSCISKSYASLKMLYPHRHSLSMKLKILLTEALVLSNFNYCDIVYGPSLVEAVKIRIQRVQRSCLRSVYGIRKYEQVIHMLSSCKWLDMEKKLRFKGLLSPSIHRTSTYIRSFSHNICFVYNRVPSNLKDISLLKFRKGF